MVQPNSSGIPLQYSGGKHHEKTSSAQFQSLLLTTAWAVAQYDSQSSSQSSSDMSKTTIEGCLSGSDGNYSLTDKSGTTYQLTGDTAKLQNHVGHTIQVTGTSASDSTIMRKAIRLNERTI